MHRSLKDLERYQVRATDGDVGKVVNFLFDDERWAIRYLVVETGGWLGGRQVLVSPISFRKAEWETLTFHVALTRDQIKNSPSIDADQPVSRQHERDYARYYGYPYYWGYMGLWGLGAYPAPLAAIRWNEATSAGTDRAPSDAHLRSVKEVRGYHIQGSDDAIGTIADFVVDDESWEIRYLVIDTGHWWTGKKVLVAPRWATAVSWEEHTVHFDMTRAWLQGCPEWNPNAAVNREYETRLYDYHGRPVYWDVGDRPVVPPRGTPIQHHP